MKQEPQIERTEIYDMNGNLIATSCGGADYRSDGGEVFTRKFYWSDGKITTNLREG